MSDRTEWKITAELVISCALCRDVVFRKEEALREHFRRAHPNKNPLSFSYWSYRKVSTIQKEGPP